MAEPEALGGLFSLALQSLEPTPESGGSHPLSASQVRELEAFGCFCRDWDRVTLVGGSDITRVEGCSFEGDVLLDLRPLDGRDSLLRRSTLRNCSTSPGCVVDGVGLLEGVDLGPCCTVERVGALTFEPGGACGVGTTLQLGVETGERDVPSMPALMPELAALLSSMPERERLLPEYARLLEGLLSVLRGRARGTVARGVTVRDARVVSGCHLGPGTVIDGAEVVRESVLLGSDAGAARISDGATVRGSALQWGVSVDSGAIVQDSVVCERSHVEMGCRVTSSLVGPNSGLGGGEVTASLAGPFTAAHHQSLLIAAWWPEGRGNVGYGANVGSNHTSRLPDQETRPAEGMFLGLGCSVKFPSDFTGSPYSVVATGVVLLPQRLSMPFSLVCEPFGHAAGVPPAYAQVIPAWMLTDNLFALLRSDAKYASRDRTSVWRGGGGTVLRRETVEPMLLAAEDLDELDGRGPYTGRDLPSLGRCFMMGEHRGQAVLAYRRFALRWALTELLGELRGRTGRENDRAGEVIRDHGPDGDSRDLMRLLARMLEEDADSARQSRARDHGRGSRVISDYGALHPPPEDDPVLRSVLLDLERLRERALDHA